MKRLQKAAVLASLIEELRAQDSWCGETHIQKNVYVLEELLGVDLGFDFTLYKHGPYSFDLSDQLSEMRADRLLGAEPQRPPYRPRLKLTETGRQLLERYPKTVRLYQEQVEQVAAKLAPKGVAELERLATALWVTRQHDEADVRTRAGWITELKPHVRPGDAMDAVEELDDMIAVFQRLPH
jgi:uncharacterized protein YwgA